MLRQHTLPTPGHFWAKSRKSTVCVPLSKAIDCEPGCRVTQNFLIKRINTQNSKLCLRIGVWGICVAVSLPPEGAAHVDSHFRTRTNPSESIRGSSDIIQRRFKWLHLCTENIAKADPGKENKPEKLPLEMSERMNRGKSQGNNRRAELHFWLQRRHKEDKRGEERQESRLTSLSPFFFLVWTERDSTSLSNWSTCMFSVSIMF